ncbi:hypothetical protein ABKW28_08840 [Nocardioides sp. 31GB23]|uniref:hypothetical protein n=1 Tax=Nocardioides sp. 31GB23 TaxID=3156065 RepID=UPI0032AF6372
MDDAQAQGQPEPQPSAAAPKTAAPSTEERSLGDRVREVREHLEQASAALAALDRLLPASTQPVDEPEDQADNRCQL